MKTYLDCVPCFIRQAIDAARMATDDIAVHERVVRETLRLSWEMDYREPPARMAQLTHRLVKKLTGNPDPYRKAKEQFNRAALELYPELKRRVECAASPLDAALRLAAAGNIIDLGAASHVDQEKVWETIENSLRAPLFGGTAEQFARSLARAGRILYLADNAGEIVFDKLLIELLPREKVTVVVRGAPAINDATMDDAQMVGLTDLVEVIDTGSDAVGIFLDSCSAEFRQRLEEADLLISKGQANYETVTELDKPTWFLLCAKCPVVARDVGCAVGDFVLKPKCCGG